MATGTNQQPATDVGLDTYFNTLPELGASDLHLKVGSPVVVRIAGILRPLDMPPLTPAQAREMCESVLEKSQLEELESVGSVDLAHSTPEGCRVRINIFYQRGVLSMAARYVNSRVPSFAELLLPEDVLKEVATYESGLVIMAGATAVGVGSAVYYQGIDTFSRIRDEMITWMTQHSFQTLDEIRGLAHGVPNFAIAPTPAPIP